MQLRFPLAFAAILSFAQADVKFTSPAAGASISGTSLSIKWADSGSSPALSDLKTYELFLCAGGNDPSTITVLTALTTTGDHSDGTSYSATFQPTVGGTTKNAYFLKIISAATGGVVINYSSRFSLTDMTGTFPVTVQTALKTVTGTTGPATQNQIAAVNNGAAAGAGDFGVAYSMQSGPTRYAPMAKRPGTKITKKNPSPQYATSAWSAWTHVSGPPNAEITFTQADTYAISSREPTIGAAPMPSDSDMQKFLNRWKD